MKNNLINKINNPINNINLQQYNNALNVSPLNTQKKFDLNINKNKLIANNQYYLTEDNNNNNNFQKVKKISSENKQKQNLFLENFQNININNNTNYTTFQNNQINNMNNMNMFQNNNIMEFKGYNTNYFG